MTKTETEPKLCDVTLACGHVQAQRLLDGRPGFPTPEVGLSSFCWDCFGSVGFKEIVRVDVLP